MNIAIVAGGDSGEYAISMMSGKQVEEQIDRQLYQPYLIEIKGNSWICLLDGESYPVDKNDFTLHLPGKHIRFDMVFNSIHGSPGENGRLQGYLDMVGIPYTSSDVVTSAITFNKAFCKNIVARSGVLTPKSVHLFRHDNEKISKISELLSLPCFVKPNNGGSSVGMTKVSSAGHFPAALELAFREDSEVLVEEFIRGRELTCGVLRTGGAVVTLPVCEIVSKKEFFDYEAKYTAGMAEEIVPAPVSSTIADECSRISASLYKLLNCKGIVRFDYIHDNEKFYFLEVNTVPGLTAASIVPKMIKVQGWSYTELVTRLIEETLRAPKSPAGDLLPL